MASIRTALVAALLAAPLVAAEPVPPAGAAGADAAIAAAGMALELDRTAEAKRWLESVPASERGWVWRLLSGRADRSVGVVADAGKPLVAAALSTNGQRFAVAPRRGEILVFATDSFQEVGRIDPAGVSTRAVALSPRGDHLLAAGGDGRLRVWNIQRKKFTVQWPGNSDELISAAWSPDGATVAVGGFVRDPVVGRPKGIVTLYTPLGLELRSFEPQAQFVGSLAFSPDGSLLVAGGPQGQLSAFDPTGAQPPRHMQVEGAESRAQIDGLAFAPDGKRLAAACGDGAVRIWRVPDWQPLVALRSGAGGHESGVNAVTFSADGARLASAGGDLTLRLWDLARNELVDALHGHLGALTAVAAAPSGELFTAAEDGTVRRWLPNVSDPVLDHAGATIGGLSVDGAGGRAATAADDGKVRLWDLASRKVVREIAAHDGRAVQALLSVDGMRLVSSGVDGHLRLWSAETGERVADLADLERGRFSALARSSDGLLFAAGTSVGTVQLRSFATGELLRVLTGHTGEVGAVEFTADGARLVTVAADGNAIVWESSSGKQLKWIHAHDAEVHGASLSPDGRLLATASNDLAVRVWDLDSGERVAQLSGHVERVWDVAWSPDGRVLASASEDFTARLWNAAGGAPLAVLHLPRPVRLVAWSKDGSTLAVAPTDGKVRLYRPAD